MYSCTNTHKLSGPLRRVCQESGQWSDGTSKCEEIRCPEPVFASHSSLSVTGNDRMYGRTLVRTSDSSQNSLQTYKVGALAKYRCERGYKIIGDPLITCEETGSWKGLVPECICKYFLDEVGCSAKTTSFLADVDCQNPPPIENGTVTLPNNATYYGAAALYECNANYKLDGISRRLCSEDGTWGHDAPVCKQITCTEPDVSENLFVDSGIQTVGTVARFTCAKGRYLVGNSTRTCMANGHWTGKNPVCKCESFISTHFEFNSIFSFSGRLQTAP